MKCFIFPELLCLFNESFYFFISFISSWGGGNEVWFPVTSQSWCIVGFGAAWSEQMSQKHMRRWINTATNVLLFISECINKHELMGPYY